MAFFAFSFAAWLTEGFSVSGVGCLQLFWISLDLYINSPVKPVCLVHLEKLIEWETDLISLWHSQQQRILFSVLCIQSSKCKILLEVLSGKMLWIRYCVRPSLCKADVQLCVLQDFSLQGCLPVQHCKLSCAHRYQRMEVGERSHSFLDSNESHLR